MKTLYYNENYGIPLKKIYKKNIEWYNLNPYE